MRFSNVIRCGGMFAFLLVAFALTAGSGRAQENVTQRASVLPDSLPDSPGASKSADAGPQTAEEKSRPRAAGTGGGQSKIWDLETRWFGQDIIGRNEKRVPLTAAQREDIYLRQTLTRPGPYLIRMVGALYDQSRGDPKEWQGGWGGYGERFASREGQFIAANSLAAAGNAALGYEVRYDKCNCDGKWPRIRHAIVRNLVTYDRSETRLRPQLGLYGGVFGAGMISAAWKPESPNPFAEGGKAMAWQVGWGSLLNLLAEFSGESKP